MGIHGDKDQRERDWVLNEFRSGKTTILIATDVTARGLGKSGHVPIPVRRHFHIFELQD